MFVLAKQKFTSIIIPSSSMISPLSSSSLFQSQSNLHRHHHHCHRLQHRHHYHDRFEHYYYHFHYFYHHHYHHHPPPPPPPASYHLNPYNSYMQLTFFLITRNTERRGGGVPPCVLLLWQLNFALHNEYMPAMELLLFLLI